MRRLLSLFRRHTVALAIGLSVIAHVGLAFGLASLASDRGPLGGQARARREIVIALPPPRTDAPAPAEPTVPVAARPAPTAGAPPLAGLSTPSLTPMPTLRSSSAEALSADLVRTRPDELGATFAGLGARQAASVVYVVDASGAMVTSLQFVLAELERSVRALSSSQSFQVVLFRDSGCEVFSPPAASSPTAGNRVVPASPANKAHLARWLKSVRPAGKSDPLAGLTRGLAFRPDAIFFLARSIPRSAGGAEAVWGLPTQALLDRLDALNPRRGDRRAVAIKAIQFLEEDPTGTMQAIARDHGDGPNSYTVLTLEQLRAR
ncbi:MAG: hypothetical protein JNM80_09600 [Phycisphaerae bacterium]|nr:hypothetical protein [Phycisphaerae bacterium]